VRLFRHGLKINPNCTRCHANLGEALLRRASSLDEYHLAEQSLREQTRLLPRDADAFFGLGVALRAQERNWEAVTAYKSALSFQANDYDGWINLAAAYGDLGESLAEAAAYRSVLRLRPDEAKAWANLGVALSTVEASAAADVDARDAEAEHAFRRAASLVAQDALPRLNLARLLLKLSRPAEAVLEFEAAAVAEPHYVGEVRMGVGTAKAQQGRMAEAVLNFEAALNADPSNAKLAASVTDTMEKATQMQAAQRSLSNGVDNLCGTPCQEVIDNSGSHVCGISWADGCGDAPPPEGFGAESIVAELCAHACAFYLVQQRAR